MDLRDLQRRHPGFREAVAADAAVTARFRGERSEFRGTADLVGQALRLALQSDAFAAQVLYRAKARLQRSGVPLLPRLLHRGAIVLGQLSIGDPVLMQPGVYVVHGQVVIDGLTEIGAGTTIAPFVTIGLKAGDLQGPRIGAGVSLGTGAKLLGPITVGDGASVGANAVVVQDVAAGVTVAGVPAKPLTRR